MDDKEILRRVIQGFQLIPAKQGFGHPYVTKTGAATPELAKRITTWINQNFPQSNIIASYEGAYKTINFRKVMSESTIIEHLVKHLISEEEFAALTRASFKNRDVRTNLFVDKLKQKAPIDLQNGEEVVIDKVTVNGEEYTESNFDKLKQVLPGLKKGDSLKFFSGDKKYSISAFAKTAELGGAGKGSGLKPEKLASGEINKQLAQIGKPITIEFNGQLYKNVTELLPAKGNRKADFYFNSTPGLFISYKQGDATHKIVAYGGIVSLRKEGNEVDKFIKAVQSQNPDFKDSRVEYGAPVKDQEIAKKALYGKDFTEGSNYGEDNVQVILQGSIELMPTDKEDVYRLRASKIITSPEVPQDGDYAPFYNARYANDRSQFGIPNSRFNIIPGGARKNAKILSID